MRGHVESVKVLLYECADPYRKDNEGNPPLFYAKEYLVKFFISRAKLVKLVFNFSCIL
jgi:hypothetical protein